MSSTRPIRAAQYLRMSTDQQQYSLDNQADAIQLYAQSHGFAVVQTYADGGKSGLSIKNRSGLAHLLQDIVSAEADFEAVLVYDVSRWGRFQDCDEAAHYEFLCKSAGVPVHYCAEQFASDDSLSTSILKALKRTMAAEFSRELSVKCFEGQKRLVQLGFRVGGIAGYGLRRMMISSDHKRNRILEEGEYKNLTTDKVILIPGPPGEVKIVREIYHMFNKEGKGVVSITNELNRRGLRYRGRLWTRFAVSNVLTKEKYVGTNVWGRTSTKLKSSTKRFPKEQWVRKRAAFEPIIDQRTFDKAQGILASDTHKLSDIQVLDSLRSLLRRKGALSGRIIAGSNSVPNFKTLQRRFGSLRRVYDLLGYNPSRSEVARCIVALRERTKKLCDELIKRLLKLFPGRLKMIPGMYSPVLCLDSGQRISVLLSAPTRSIYRKKCWRVRLLHPERSTVLLLCRMNKQRDGFVDMHIIPQIGLKVGWLYVKKQNDKWLKTGQRLRELSEFCDATEKVARSVANSFDVG
jgi:DNA invertase Pin-like site-specific DNA recombinase